MRRLLDALALLTALTLLAVLAWLAHVLLWLSVALKETP